MESVMMATPMAPAAYYMYTPEQSPDARRHGSFVPQQQQVQQQQQQPVYYYMMPPTPTFSRPSSSSSAHMPQHMVMPQPLKPFMGAHANPYATMVPATSAPMDGTQGLALVHNGASVVRRAVAGGKPAIMLETEFVDVDGHSLCLPSTPTLSSTASSTIGSPSAGDMLATPLNPMFSGLDSGCAAKDAGIADVTAEQFSAASWSGCASPPFTPVFIQTPSQPAKALAAPHSHATPATLSSSDLLSVSACPSLSSSPSPYARSVASEQDNDFCDPRNLTVSGNEGSVSPVFSAAQPQLTPAADAEDDLVLRNEPTSATAEPSPAAPSASSAALSSSPESSSLTTAGDFVPHSLSVLDEFPDLDSDDDFVNTLVNLGADFPSISTVGTPDLSIRSRASSSATAHSELEFFDSWESPSSSLSSFSSVEGTESQHPSKRQRTSSGTFSVLMAGASASEADHSASASASGSAEQQEPQQQQQQASGAASDGSSSRAGGHSATPEGDSTGAGNGGSGGSSRTSSAPVPTNRRGRKQSLTEDPSKIFACDLCDRRFRRQEHLKRHHRSLHTEEKPFNCPECGKKFSRSDNLAQHSRTHGTGSMVMSVFDDPNLVAAASAYVPRELMYGGHVHHTAEDYAAEDYANMGRVLFQVAAEVPGSSSEPSSDDGSDNQSKKKRKRAD